MRTTTLDKTIRAALFSVMAVVIACGTNVAAASSAVPETGLSAEARAALTTLTSTTPAAASLMQGAKAVLVFPNVVKGGFLVGVSHGEGVMFKQGKIAGYYNTSGASYGLQAGVQQYGYALFFMNDQALQSLNTTEGFQIGVGPSIVVVNSGMAKSLTTSTIRSDTYAFIFDQRGLMAGLGLQGSKIYRIDR